MGNSTGKIHLKKHEFFFMLASVDYGQTDAVLSAMSIALQHRRHFFDLWNLTVLCKGISQYVRDYISATYVFRYNPKGFLCYNPRHLNVAKRQFNLSPYSSLSHLSFAKGLKGELPLLPPSLTHLRLLAFCDTNVDNLPSSLLSLEITSNVFNQPLDHLPPSLTYLYILSVSFKHPIDHLPPSLNKLHLIGDLNLPLDHLPSSLTYLDIDLRSFNHPIDHLPSSLLTFGIMSSDFDQALDHLPPSLTHLRISAKTGFDQSIDHLPSSLTSLDIFLEDMSIDNLPSSLSHLSISTSSSIYHLPSSLSHLKLSRHFNQAVNHLPPALTHLTFGEYFNQRISHLPSSITHLVLGRRFDQALYLPSSLTHLVTGRKFTNAAVVNPFPPSLMYMVVELDDWKCPFSPSITHLTFGNTYDSPIIQFPPYLTHLILGYQYNQLLPPLPPSLTHLVLGHQFAMKLPSPLPSLTHLRLGPHVKNVDGSFLPSTLTHLSCIAQQKRFPQYSTWTIPYPTACFYSYFWYQRPGYISPNTKCFACGCIDEKISNNS